MAYTERQHAIIAYAIALSGYNVAAAVRWLSERSAEIGQVGESTVRRFLKQPKFQALVESQARIVAEERENAIREAERARLKSEIQGTVAERLHAMESRAHKLFEKLEEEMDKPDVDKRLLIRLWERLEAFTAAARKDAAPVVAETWQAQALIESMKAVLSKRVPEAAPSILKDWLKEYQARVTTARETHEAPDDGTQEERAANAG